MSPLTYDLSLECLGCSVCATFQELALPPDRVDGQQASVVMMLQQEFGAAVRAFMDAHANCVRTASRRDP